MDWPIGEIARLSGTTSRTLRHYDAIGLLKPSRVADSGQRHYNSASLLKLQHILVLRELGLGLDNIREIVEHPEVSNEILEKHLKELQQQRDRLDKIIGTVTKTLGATREGKELMAEEILAGFDHQQYEEEVVDRWGQEAWDRGNRAWAGMGIAGQKEHLEVHTQITRELAEAAASGLTADSSEVQDLVRRHHKWVTAFAKYSAEAYAGLGEMYVADPRFRKTYDSAGEGTAELLAAGMRIFAETL